MLVDLNCVAMQGMHYLFEMSLDSHMRSMGPGLNYCAQKWMNYTKDPHSRNNPKIGTRSTVNLGASP